MAYVSYCKKCKAEIPASGICPNCGAKLTKSSERLSFGVVITPVKDWFAWNRMLRVALPAMLLVLLILLLIEYQVAGLTGLSDMLTEGLIWLILGALALTALIWLVVLLMQGKESVHYVLDSAGAHVYTYLKNPTRVKLAARLITPETVKALCDSGEDNVPGLKLISARHLLWQDMRKVRLWRENGRILLFRPAWWLCLVMTATNVDFDPAEAMIRKKLSRNKRARVVPKK